MAALDSVERACPLCGARAGRVIYEATVAPGEALRPEDFNCTNAGHGEHYRILRCASCPMVYCSPRPSALAIAEAYKTGEDRAYVEAEEGRRATFARALRRIRGPRGSGRLLDVGCNTGVFLEEAARRGFDAYGVEPSEFAAVRARDVKGLRVHCGSLPCALPWPEPFDVVTCWDVIEHVDDPLQVARFVRSLLRPGGELHLSTMDFGSLYARLCGRRWPWLMRMHIHYFTRRSMAGMLRRAGFSEVAFERYSHVIPVDYLRRKLAGVALPLRIAGRIGALLLRDRRGLVRVDMGDMMHAVARA